MKNLQSTIEGTWIEIKQVTLTEEQIALLTSVNSQAKTDLMAEIKSQREVAATKSDTDLAVSKYNEVKPALETTDVYELIAMDVVVTEETLLGILNCRVNGEHKQIRF